MNYSSGDASVLKVKSGENPGKLWNVIYSSALVENSIYRNFTIDGGDNLLEVGNTARPTRSSAARVAG